MDSQAWLVFWGAFGGGAAGSIFTLMGIFLSEWLRWRKGRPSLKVSAHMGLVPTGSGQDYKKMLLLEAKNYHPGMVKVTSHGCQWKKWGQVYLKPQSGHQFPCEIGSGDNLLEWVDLPEFFEFLKKNGATPRDLSAVWFRSAAGDIFSKRIHKNVIKNLTSMFESADPIGS